MLMKQGHDLNSEAGNPSFSGVTRQLILEIVKNILIVEVKGYCTVYPSRSRWLQGIKM